MSVLANPLCIHLVWKFQINHLLVTYLPLRLGFLFGNHIEAHASCLKPCHNGPYTVRALSSVAFLQHSAIIHMLTF